MSMRDFRRKRFGRIGRICSVRPSRPGNVGVLYGTVSGEAQSGGPVPGARQSGIQASTIPAPKEKPAGPVCGGQKACLDDQHYSLGVVSLCPRARVRSKLFPLVLGYRLDALGQQVGA